MSGSSIKITLGPKPIPVSVEPIPVSVEPTPPPEPEPPTTGKKGNGWGKGGKKRSKR